MKLLCVQCKNNLKNIRIYILPGEEINKYSTLVGKRLPINIYVCSYFAFSGNEKAFATVIREM